MTLTLAIGNGARLDNGAPGELVLHRRGAIAGRAPTCDWPLPDPAKHVSSRHFEITFDGHAYFLSDTSTNGTFVNGATTRLAEPHRIAQGDRFQVGPFLIYATLTGEALTAQHEAGQSSAAPERSWAGWQSNDSGSASHVPASSGWGAAPPPPTRGSGRWEPAIGPSVARSDPYHSGGGAPSSAPRPGEGLQSSWAPPATPTAPPSASTWEETPAAPDPASGWSSAAPNRPAAPTPDDVWGRLAEGNVVDWARGGFGQPVEPNRDPLGLEVAPAKASLPTARPDIPVAAPPPPPPPPPAPATASRDFLASAGLPGDIKGDPAAAERRAGGILRKLVAGLVVMVEARARAKAQLGAEATAFNPEGHNPLKFARTPEEALTMLLEPAQRGFMDPERAVEDAFQELQTHQMATLRAMQGALRATLDRFSPTAIRARADAGGVFERILPAARDAALWQAYEKEFGGVAQGSDEAFMDVFAKEFRRAYNEQSRRNS
jgi:type VI secretion system FHA domain protein